MFCGRSHYKDGRRVAASTVKGEFPTFPQGYKSYPESSIPDCDIVDTAVQPRTHSDNRFRGSQRRRQRLQPYAQFGSAPVEPEWPVRSLPRRHRVPDNETYL
jgi:hypothetical protein